LQTDDEDTVASTCNATTGFSLGWMTIFANPLGPTSTQGPATELSQSKLEYANFLSKRCCLGMVRLLERNTLG